jgi:hypothetical protein
MKFFRTKSAIFAILFLVAVLCVSMIFFTHISPRVSAQVLHPQKPQSGCCAIAYVHTATVSNTVANWTELDNKDTNNNPNAFVIATPNRTGRVVDTHPIGVWYDAMTGRWAIFNQDGAAMFIGSAFDVYALQSASSGGGQSVAILHTATSSNSKGNWTDIDSPVANNNPAAFVNVTLNWNPGGAGGVSDPHPLGVWYDTAAKKWAIFNEGSMDPIPAGAAFNVFLNTPGVSGVFLHTSTAANTSLDHTTIDNPATNNNPKAVVLVTPNFNPQGQGGSYEPYPVGVSYNHITNKWTILNLDGSDMPLNVSFDVLAVNATS